MKVIEIKDIEDCFDGSFIRELLLDENTDKNFIQSLSQFGQLRYFPDFARPFFKVLVPKVAEFKGVEGNNTIRLLLYDENAKKWMNKFVNWIEDQVKEYCVNK